jgi:hypothetical protein
MKRLTVLFTAFFLFSAFQCLTTDTVAAQDATESTLSAGRYRAKLHGVMSHSCFERVRHTLSTMEGIAYVVADPKANEMVFGVRNDARVLLRDVQWALRSAGVKSGTLYRLEHVHVVSKD